MSPAPPASGAFLILRLALNLQRNPARDALGRQFDLAIVEQRAEFRRAAAVMRRGALRSREHGTNTMTKPLAPSSLIHGVGASQVAPAGERRDVMTTRRRKRRRPERMVRKLRDADAMWNAG